MGALSRWPRLCSHPNQGDHKGASLRIGQRCNIPISVGVSLVGARAGTRPAPTFLSPLVVPPGIFALLRIGWRCPYTFGKVNCFPHFFSPTTFSRSVLIRANNPNAGSSTGSCGANRPANAYLKRTASSAARGQLYRHCTTGLLTTVVGPFFVWRTHHLHAQDIDRVVDPLLHRHVGVSPTRVERGYRSDRERP